jgi:hypothetical protein
MDRSWLRSAVQRFMLGVCHGGDRLAHSFCSPWALAHVSITGTQPRAKPCSTEHYKRLTRRRGRSRSYKGDVFMECATEDLIRRFWARRFPALDFPEDFLKNWTAREEHAVIKAFNNTASWHRKHSDKGNYDVAKVLTADLKRQHMQSEEPNANYRVFAKACVFEDLWKDYFPQYGSLPPETLEYWVSRKRFIHDVIYAFKTVKKYPFLNEKKNLDVINLLSEQMTRLAKIRETIPSCNLQSSQR